VMDDGQLRTATSGGPAHRAARTDERTIPFNAAYHVPTSQRDPRFLSDEIGDFFSSSDDPRRRWWMV
jgi:hypothetical protein